MKDRNCRNELNRLKNRLFGVNGADCLNLGNSDGLLEQIKQRLNDDIINRLVAKIEETRSSPLFRSIAQREDTI